MDAKKDMIENAEGPPKLSPALVREAAALIVSGRDRGEVAGLLGVDLSALARHLGPIGRETEPAGGLVS
ncbi:hypothetical protein [Microvirga sesbaniae]|uniref:hypothetical protein n=1 Tax=Microvirga sesbaniae TaxID=681392 RepID=UPI0021C707CE|nr:hypothetical protein [Microvirga sp. HBU67692]